MTLKSLDNAVVSLKIVIQGIRESIKVINSELGKVMNDIKWIKRIGYYLVTIITIMLIRSFI